MTATIEHSANGTLVHGTTRDDTATLQVLKANGFRWSRNLHAWYLPRNLRHETRDERVRNVEKALGDGVEVTIPDGGRRQSAAERENARIERAADRAERKTAQADKLEAQADALHQSAENRARAIPLGQPNITDTAAGRAFARHREKIHDTYDRSFRTAIAADSARAAAERATRTATGTESVSTISNRIERNEALVRKIDREIDTHDTAQGIIDKLTARSDEPSDEQKAALETLSDADLVAELGRLGRADKGDVAAAERYVEFSNERHRRVEADPGHRLRGTTVELEVRNGVAMRRLPEDAENVQTEHGPGRVATETDRSITIQLDTGDQIRLTKGTPGYGRITRTDPPAAAGGRATALQAARRDVRSPERLDQLDQLKAEAVDAIAHDKAKLEAAGGIDYGKHNVRPGDIVNAAGRWLPAVRVNAKTVTVPTGYSWTNTVPWSKVSSVTKAEDFSPGQVVQMLEGAGDDQNRRAALEKTLARAEQAATPAPTPRPADDPLPLDTPTVGETSRAEQRLRQHPRQQPTTAGGAPPTPGQGRGR